ncbi:MAG: GH116 family glycosyl hydrolase, partial [Planctomycetota bacterium]|nr:GH116 family glycosyl hydrolase [Planctomycetota bacterium]
WAWQLDLGYIYPKENVQKALAAVFKHNWTSDIGPYNKAHPPQRWFARAGEAGLFTCTWPRGGRPAEPVLYRDEVWTGIEYQAAGHMIAEGMVREALAIIRGVHDRYDGARHNPWNEVECGDHYARAMASWGCLLTAEGFVYDGPAGKIGFGPRLTPEDFKAFFTAAEGWGSLVQKRAGRSQTDRIDVKWGKLSARSLRFEVPENAGAVKAEVTAAGRKAAAKVVRDGAGVTLSLAEPVTVSRGEKLEVVLTWE